MISAGAPDALTPFKSRFGPDFRYALDLFEIVLCYQ